MCRKVQSLDSLAPEKKRRGKGLGLITVQRWRFYVKFRKAVEGEDNGGWIRFGYGRGRSGRLHRGRTETDKDEDGE